MEEGHNKFIYILLYCLVTDCVAVAKKLQMV